MEQDDKKKLRDEIFEKHKKLYRLKTASSETRSRYPMQWGFECGDGWMPLISDLSDSIQWHADHKKEKDPNFKQPEVVQCKEKFGTLRFYIRGGDEYIAGLIHMAEKISGRICETCGSPGVLQSTGWWRVICKSCNDKRNITAAIKEEFAEETSDLEDSQ